MEPLDLEPDDGFRQGMRRLASGVSVIAAAGPDGLRCGITATAVCSLTVEPPALVACVHKETRLGRVLQETEVFSVNLLAMQHRRVAEAFAGMVPGVRGSRRFLYGDWRHGENGTPVLADAPACFSCRLGDIVERSTHLLLIGEVFDVRVTGGESSPLVYVSRRFTGVAPV